jgi:hypothetical protein
MNDLIIDIATRDKAKIIARLAKLKTTGDVADGGEYHMDRYYSVIRLTTTRTETEVEDWLYNMKAPVDYVGVCPA